jgi:predicted kinase
VKPELLLLCGLPASGKSTYAKEWVAEDPDGRVRINYDDMRLARYGAGWKWNRRDEDGIKKDARRIATEAINAGLSVVIDNTNLSKGVREGWKALAVGLGATYSDIEFDTPIEECIRRDTQRAVARVGRGVIERMALFNGFIDFTAPEYQAGIVIVDIDGTVADCEHRMHHIKPAWETGTDCSSHFPESNGGCSNCGYKPKKNWAAFHDPKLVAQDTLIEPLSKLVGAMFHYGYHIIFLTGRDTSIAKVTEDWLNENLGTHYKHLFMRQSGDSRKDYEHKLEVLSFIPKDRVVFILEDRDQCVRAFRDAGYTCLQVKDGAY